MVYKLKSASMDTLRDAVWGASSLVSKKKDKKPAKKRRPVEEEEAIILEKEKTKAEYFRVKDLEELVAVTEILEKAIRGEIQPGELSKLLSKKLESR